MSETYETRSFGETAGETTGLAVFSLAILAIPFTTIRDHAGLQCRYGAGQQQAAR